MEFRIGDLVQVSSINSAKWCGQQGRVTEMPCSHNKHCDYGIDLFGDGRPTIGMDIDQLILVGDGDSYNHIQATKSILRRILADLEGKLDAWYIGKDRGIRIGLALLEATTSELRKDYPEDF